MTLDLTKIAAQVEGMVAQLQNNAIERQEHLGLARTKLCDKNCDLEKLRRKIAAGKTSWLVADPVERMDNHYKSPSLPSEFNIIATDGSNIDVDRHKSTRCYLINTGTVLLHYGDNPNAVLDNLPRLYSSDNDLVIREPGGKAREQIIDGELLGIKRAVEECSELTRMAAETLPGSYNLALIDGSLIYWKLGAKYPDFVIDELLNRGFLNCLDRMMDLNKDRKLALASYISFPGSTEVVNILRLAICPQEQVDCDHCTFSGKDRPCEAVAGVQDQWIFSHVLEPGERSALFISQSSIVMNYYGNHRVYFFYLRTGDEIARVEVPQWVARDRDLLGLTHTLVLDQCRRGHGYPVALSEAHEKAVVTGADREQFWQLVESSLVEKHISGSTSIKSQSKLTRWI